jgi:peptidoglycan/LPS O-acetylase OafA/YrhL
VRQNQLDGVRGFAVLLVIAHHHYLLPAGWFGVTDLFFVLSGFLITRNLLRSREIGHYWSQFYIKRAGRIFPALFLLFPLVLMLSRHVTGIGVLGYAFFLGNYMNLTRYSAGLLVVLWSLAIEEHFYLLWPTVVRYVSRRHMVQALVGILLLEPILRLTGTRFVSSYEAIYYLTWFRLDSIAAGCLLATLGEYPKVAFRIMRWSLPLCAATTVGFIVLVISYGARFTKEVNSPLFNSLGYSMIAAASFFLVGHLVGHDTSWLAKAFSLKPLVFFGKISYGLYLFHEVVLAIMRRLLHIAAGPASASATRRLFWLDLPLVVVFSWLSFRLIELPVIEWSRRKALLLRERDHRLVTLHFTN